MKVIKSGKVTIDSEDIFIEGFSYDSSGDCLETELDNMRACAIASLDWVEKRISELRAEIEDRTAEFSGENNKWDGLQK